MRYLTKSLVTWFWCEETLAFFLLIQTFAHDLHAGGSEFFPWWKMHCETFNLLLRESLHLVQNSWRYGYALGKVLQFLRMYTCWEDSIVEARQTVEASWVPSFPVAAAGETMTCSRSSKVNFRAEGSLLNLRPKLLTATALWSGQLESGTQPHAPCGRHVASMG